MLENPTKCVLSAEEGYEPVRSTETSAGYDVRAHTFISVSVTHNEHEAPEMIKLGPEMNSLVLFPGQRVLIDTGVRIESMEPNFHLEVRSKSGLAVKKGLVVLNSPGTIDADYKDNILVCLQNTTEHKVSIRKDEYIAQLVLSQHHTIFGDVVLKEDKREGGFGSTGTK